MQRAIIRNTPLIFVFFVYFISPVLLLGASSAPDPALFRPSPKRLTTTAEVIVEWVAPLDECPEEKVCVEGQLHNTGKKPAYGTYLRIDIGGTKYIKPTTYLYSRLEEPVMAPGDRQEFYLEINRKIHYKKRKKIKTIEVGKYNFKVIPLWSDKDKKTGKKSNR